MDWLCFLLGALASGPLAALAVFWRARRQLLRARRLAERARTRQHLVELAKLTGGLAHEIKNPLSTLKLNLKLLAEEFEHSRDDVHRRNFARLQRLQNEVQRVNDILDDFLKYAGRPELHRSEVDLRKLIEELMDFFRPQAESHRVVLRAWLPEVPVCCRVDVGLLKQAILNLMINATQAMPEGGELLLRLGGQNDRACHGVAPASRAVLEVIDTGPGIEPSVLKRVFDAYFTTRPGGSGLGLPTTRRIVRLHQGDIQVTSELGKGTRFVIELPTTGGPETVGPEGRETERP